MTINNNPYFNANALPTARDEYVCWLDIMGVQAAMMRSLNVTANFVFKLHTMVLEQPATGVTLYPVMDGVYLTSPERTRMRAFLEGVLRRAAQLFVSTPVNEHRFLVKSAVAWGPVIHGRDVPTKATPVFGKHAPYRNALLLGMPMVNAHLCEHQAPPFGVYVHGSASEWLESWERAKSAVWWPWFAAGTDPDAKSLKPALVNYFEWALARAGAIAYDASRMTEHKSRALQYLADS